MIKFIFLYFSFIFRSRYYFNLFFVQKIKNKYLQYYINSSLFRLFCADQELNIALAPKDDMPFWIFATLIGGITIASCVNCYIVSQIYKNEFNELCYTLNHTTLGKYPLNSKAIQNNFADIQSEWIFDVINVTCRQPLSDNSIRLINPDCYLPSTCKFLEELNLDSLRGVLSMFDLNEKVLTSYMQLFKSLKIEGGSNLVNSIWEKNAFF